MNRLIIFLSVLLAIVSMGHAQTDVTYDIGMEGAFGSDSNMPYYLVSNRHGMVSSENNSGYVTAGIAVEHKMGDWTLDGRVKMEAQTNAYSSAYLQECYGELSWKKLSLMVGSKEQEPLLRDMQLSSGAWTWSGNCRPIPQAKFGFNRFIAVPFSTRWLEFFFDGCYGKTIDGDWLQDRYDSYITRNPNAGDRYITRDYWYHYKRGYFRINTHSHILFTAGIEHAAQFGGRSNSYSFQNLQDGNIPEWNSQPTDLGNFFSILIPGRGDENSPRADKVFFYGNHLGSINFLMEYQWGRDMRHKVGAYLENPYEDGSGMRKGNGWDGIWGLEYHDKDVDAPVTGAVFEYIQTTHQSGPILWSPENDHKGEAVADFITNGVSGCDNYYNHYYYNGYHYYGMSMGTPMLKSPAFNNDDYLQFVHNRINAWHVGVNGHLYTFNTGKPSRIDYRVLGSYLKGWGTYHNPSYDIDTSTNGLVELTWSRGPWNAALSYAFDRGEMLGNNQAVCLRLNYRGVIFKGK